MKKILYCILHTEKNFNRYQNIISTWGKNVDFVFLSDNEDEEKKIIKVSDNKSYESGQEKQINGLNYLHSLGLDYDFYFFCDDDCFVNTKQMNNFISDCATNCVWGQVCNCWDSDRTLHYALGGAGILISKEIMSYLEGKLKQKSVPWGDVSLGINLRHRNIEVKNSDLFKSQPPNHYGINNEEIRNFITFHYIKSHEEMEKLYNLCL